MRSLRALAALCAIALLGSAAHAPAQTGRDDPFYGQNTRFSWSGELTQGGYIRGLAPDGALSVVVGDTPVELSADGTFFAAFDRDAPSTLALSARLDGGQLHGETLTITPRQWQIERIAAPKRASGSNEAYWKIREPEYNAINAARAQRTGATGWRQDFIWPVKGRISGRFGRQRIYNGEPADYHSGIDIAPGNGVPFVAPADGVVVLARTGFSLEGGLIIIDHGNGLNSAFLHASKIVVREGERVAQGQHIGNVGATGRATGPHLHWSLKWNDARLDPLLFTGPMH
jgi:murein DD-endopeptidase MepM/ murein hydrolase activator NlpD